MISNERLKQRILDLAFSSNLVKNDTTLKKFNLIEIEKIKNQKIIDGKLREEKKLKPITDKDIPYSIPNNWQWVRLGNYVEKVTDQVASGSFASLRENVKSLKEPNYAIMVKVADFSNNFTSNLTYTDEHGYNFLSNSNLFGGELILSNVGSIGKIFIVPKLESKMTLAPNSVMIRFIRDEHRDYIYYFLLSPQGYKEIYEITTGTAVRKFNKTDLKKILLPIPPLEEQNKIVKRIHELFSLIDKKEKNDQEITKLKKVLKEKVLDSAIRGNLVENDNTLEPIDVNAITENIPFNVPLNWKWVTFDSISDIVRGGSPRPIKDYLTDSEDGINWIKIGDTNPDDIYINNVKEKIKPEGMKRSRFVEKGSLLLTNSMSFGRPYILNVDGCIHDGWLNIKDKNNNYYNMYMVYLLSSNYFYSVMSNKSSGAVVSNLNIDKVKTMLIPIPPLEEQKRIVEKIENIFELIEQL